MMYNMNEYPYDPCRHIYLHLCDFLWQMLLNIPSMEHMNIDSDHLNMAERAHQGFTMERMYIFIYIYIQINIIKYHHIKVHVYTIHNHLDKHNPMGNNSVATVSIDD